MIPVIPGGPDDHQSDDSALRSYRDTAHESFTPPPPGVIVGRARARVRNRVVLAAAAAVILVAGGVVIAARPGAGPEPDHPVEPPPPAPTPAISVVPTPSPRAPSTPPSNPTSDPGVADAPTSTSTSPSSSPTTPPLDLHDVKWDDFVLRFPSARGGNECPTGRRELTDGRWPESGDQGPGVINGPATYGDLNGDGRDEAVLRISCFFAGGDSGDAAGQLIVVTARGQQRVGLGYAGPLGQSYQEVRVTGGKLVVTIEQRHTDVTQKRTYAWNGSAIVQVAGPTAFPTS
jgi:hypothetical protein